MPPLTGWSWSYNVMQGCYTSECYHGNYIYIIAVRPTPYPYYRLTSRTAQQDTDTSLLHVSNNSTSSVHSSTDGSSPLLNQRATAGMYVRARAVSVADPNPVIKLVLDGIARTVHVCVCVYECVCVRVVNCLLVSVTKYSKTMQR